MDTEETLLNIVLALIKREGGALTISCDLLHEIHEEMHEKDFVISADHDHDTHTWTFRSTNRDAAVVAAMRAMLESILSKIEPTPNTDEELLRSLKIKP